MEFGTEGGACGSSTFTTGWRPIEIAGGWERCTPTAGILLEAVDDVRT
jgi:hypothetical protein